MSSNFFCTTSSVAADGRLRARTVFLKCVDQAAVANGTEFGGVGGFGLLLALPGSLAAGE
ncbi:MAG: hypothetical protein ACK58L_01205 [Planctomycetota bacterium]